MIGMLSYKDVEWLTIVAGSDYEPVIDRVRDVLLEIGRMKYLRPLYTALGRRSRTRILAKEICEKGKARYHSLSRRAIDSVMEKCDEVHR
jgi:leukotriene-A4 hydrolase